MLEKHFLTRRQIRMLMNRHMENRKLWVINDELSSKNTIILDQYTKERKKENKRICGRIVIKKEHQDLEKGIIEATIKRINKDGETLYIEDVILKRLVEQTTKGKQVKTKIKWECY